MKVKHGPENYGSRPNGPGIFAVQTAHWLFFKRKTGYVYMDKRGALSHPASTYGEIWRAYNSSPVLENHQIMRDKLRWWQAVEVVEMAPSIVEQLKAQVALEAKAKEG